MRSDARLDSAVFQLTPTRTRCDLVITANGKAEKIASGLLNPFLAHLKAAQDQIAKGGYSITLEPDHSIDAAWFTKGTVERFVRFVSTPEVLERVTTIESEILQIEEAISIQGNDNLGLSTVEDHHTKSDECIEGSKPLSDADAEKAIVLYKPGSHSNPPESNGSSTQEENSKVQLLRVLETRKIVLQKEQGMAFARAAAAGFDMDRMAYLISFAECFGASRLKEACLQFMELWRIKHETGQWLEVEAAEAMSSRSGFSPFNASGIVLSGDMSKQKEFGEAWPVSAGDLGTERNGNAGSHASAEPGSHHLTSDHNRDHQVPMGPHEYFQGQFQQPTYPQWPMHAPPGPPVFQPYPMQGMPYYQNYPGSGPYFHSPYPPPEDPRSIASQKTGMRRHSMKSKDGNIDSENWESGQNDGSDENSSEFEKEASRGQKSHKRLGRSGKKKSGMVVIKNLNYITSKRRETSGGESQSASGSETEEENEGSLSDAVERKLKKPSKSIKKKDGHTKPMETSKEYDKDEVVYGQDADSGNWQAFQSFLLTAEEKMASTVDGDIFAGEKGTPIKRRQNTSEAEPILTPDRDSGSVQEPSILEFDSANGRASRTRQMASHDELSTSSEGRGLRDGQFGAEFKEIEGGGRGYRRATSEDFMIYGRENPMGSKGSSDPLADNVYEHSSNMDRGSYIAADESFIVPFRAGSQDQHETDSRTAIDMDLEFPSSLQRKEDSSSKVKSQLRYEPEDLTLMPERTIASEYIGYDPAKDYDMEIPIEIAVKQETINQEDTTSTKEEPKKSEKDKKLKVPQDGFEKRKKDSLMRRGTSKSNPLAEAQKRADKLRAFKVDLQKAKKENEEEQRRRLEALKLERQKRIAARSGSNAAQSPTATKQTRTTLPTKHSPSSYKGSKFIDSQPGSNSPLQKLPTRNTSVGSNDPQKNTKTNKSNGSTSELSQSVSSLPELKKDNHDLKPEARTISARLRRLSDPKGITTQRASQKLASTDQIPKRNMHNEPQMKKISAILQLDQTKSATLPELKVRTPRGSLATVHDKSATKETLQKGLGNKTSTASESFKDKKTNEKPPRLSDSDDNPIEKTVVMLESQMVAAPTVQASEGVADTISRSHRDDQREKAGPGSEYASIRAPPSPIVMGEVEDQNDCKLEIQLNSYEVIDNVSKDESQNFSNSSVTNNFYQAPYARATTLEDSNANNVEYTEAPAVLNSEIASMHNESIMAHVSNFSDSSSIDQSHESNEKPRSKESKGFRKLLKFGRKSHGSASGEGTLDSDGSVGDDHTEAAASSNDIHTLKNLISQDDTHPGSTPPRVHRPFSILSPFRSSKTNEKKQAA